MRPRHFIAALLGLLVGSLVNLEYSSVTDVWNIPWFANATPDMMPLHVQAHLLKAIRFFLFDNGFVLVFTCMAIALILAKMDEMGNRSIFYWCFSKSVFITIASVFLVSFTWGMLAGQTDSEVPPNFEYKLFCGFERVLFLLWIAFHFLVAPIFCLLVFGVLVSLREKYLATQK